MKKLIIASTFFLFSCASNNDHLPDSTKATAQLAVQVGALDKAQELAVKNVKAHPDDVDARFYLADVYAKRSKYDMENQELEIIESKVDKRSDDYPRVVIELMRNSLKRNNYKNVISLYKNKLSDTRLGVTMTGEQVGKSIMLVGIAHCKLNEYDDCIRILKSAGKYLPGDNALADNLQIAQYMSKANHGQIDLAPLYAGYSNTESNAMYANLVMALIRNNQDNRAYELLSSRYSREDATIIINDLKQIKRKDNVKS